MTRKCTLVNAADFLDNKISEAIESLGRIAAQFPDTDKLIGSPDFRNALAAYDAYVFLAKLVRDEMAKDGLGYRPGVNVEIPGTEFPHSLYPQSRPDQSQPARRSS